MGELDNQADRAQQSQLAYMLRAQQAMPIAARLRAQQAMPIAARRKDTKEMRGFRRVRTPLGTVMECVTCGQSQLAYMLREPPTRRKDTKMWWDERVLRALTVDSDHSYIMAALVGQFIFCMVGYGVYMEVAPSIVPHWRPAWGMLCFCLGPVIGALCMLGTITLVGVRVRRRKDGKMPVAKLRGGKAPDDFEINGGC